MDAWAGRLTLLLGAAALAGCGEYARADWPDLTEDFTYRPSDSATETAGMAPPAAVLGADEVSEILDAGRSRLETAQAEIRNRMAAYEEARGVLAASPGGRAQRAWLSAQLALSRVSQAGDQLTLLAADLSRARAQADETTDPLGSLLEAVGRARAALEARLKEERNRLEQARPQ